MFITNNNDSGSLKVGLSAGSKVWKVGDKIRILGEDKVRTVTFIMPQNKPQSEKLHLCFKGQGRLPEGEVSYEVVED